MEGFRISIVTGLSILIFLECIYSITSTAVQQDPVRPNSPRPHGTSFNDQKDVDNQQRFEFSESDENVFISLGDRVRRGSYDDKDNEINDDTVADSESANEPPKNSKQSGRSKPRMPPPRRGDRRAWSRSMGRSLNEMVAEKNGTNNGTDAEDSDNMDKKRKGGPSSRKNSTFPVILEGNIPCEIRENPEDKEADIDKRWDMINIFAVKEYSAQHIKILNETLNIFREAAPCLPINLLREGSDERPTEGTYLELDYEHTGLCYSYIGRTKSESQSLGLPPSCMTPELIAHEFMHALGFDHEQCRPDRDDFVEIYWHNFHPGEGYSSYEIKPEALAIGPYDFGSIMHFKPIGNTVGGPTMQSKTGEDLGNNDGKLTELDKEKIRQLYCPNLLPGNAEPCNKKLAKIMEREKGRIITTKRTKKKLKW